MPRALPLLVLLSPGWALPLVASSTLHLAPTHRRHASPSLLELPELPDSLPAVPALPPLPETLAGSLTTVTDGLTSAADGAMTSVTDSLTTVTDSLTTVTDALPSVSEIASRTASAQSAIGGVGESLTRAFREIPPLDALDLALISPALLPLAAIWVNLTHIPTVSPFVNSTQFFPHICHYPNSFPHLSHTAPFSCVSEAARASASAAGATLAQRAAERKAAEAEAAQEALAKKLMESEAKVVRKVRGVCTFEEFSAFSFSFV